MGAGGWIILKILDPYLKKIIIENQKSEYLKGWELMDQSLICISSHSSHSSVALNAEGRRSTTYHQSTPQVISKNFKVIGRSHWHSLKIGRGVVGRHTKGVRRCDFFLRSTAKSKLSLTFCHESVDLLLKGIGHLPWRGLKICEKDVRRMKRAFWQCSEGHRRTYYGHRTKIWDHLTVWGVQKWVACPHTWSRDFLRLSEWHSQEMWMTTWHAGTMTSDYWGVSRALQNFTRSSEVRGAAAYPRKELFEFVTLPLILVYTYIWCLSLMLFWYLIFSIRVPSNSVL